MHNIHKKQEEHMKIIYDLSTIDTCMQFLTTITKRNREDIDNFLRLQEKEPYSYDDVLEDFLNTLQVNLEEMNVEDITFAGIHITTNNDNCASIKKYGLLNLRQALTMDTPIKRFLKDWGIQFHFNDDFTPDIVTFTGIHNGELIKEVFSIEDFSKTFKGYSSLIHTKLTSSSHYPINAFLFINDYKSYGGNVHDIPEFISHFGNSLPTNDFIDAWKKDRKSYAIKFYADFDTCNVTTLLPHSTNLKEDILNDYEEIKKALLKKCIETSINHIHQQDQSKIYLYMKPEAIIPYGDIYEIIDIETKENIR